MNNSPHTQQMSDHRHSAEPVEIDVHGRRKRTREYIKQGNRDIELKKLAGDSYVKHKQYTQPRAGKNATKKLVVIILSIFLFYCISLSAVFLIATMIKSSSALPEDSQSSSLQSDSNPQDTTTPPSPEDSQGDIEVDTPPEPEQIYASVTPSTFVLTDEIDSANAILIDLNSFTVVAQKGGDQRIYPASMTKIMTLLVAVENMQSLDQTAKVTRETVDYCYLEEASVAGFEANETVTMRDLLYGTILPSGADATKTLAECISGTEAEFVKLMNEKAIELGLENTHFENTSGLHHDNHYTTAHDTALILKAALENEVCFKVLTSSHYITSQTTQHENGIPLYSIVHSRVSAIKSPDFTILGGKTGYTPEAGRCLATYAITDDNREFIFVSAGALETISTAEDAEYAYKTFTKSSDGSAA